jgi:hypothetical protein
MPLFVNSVVLNPEYAGPLERTIGFGKSLSFLIQHDLADGEASSKKHTHIFNPIVLIEYVSPSSIYIYSPHLVIIGLFHCLGTS